MTDNDLAMRPNWFMFVFCYSKPLTFMDFILQLSYKWYEMQAYGTMQQK